MTTGEQRYSQDELNTREAIVLAAINLFGQHGFRGTSIRQIARDAGVSAGLVQHHFKTKDGIRVACDEHVMNVFRSTRASMLQRGAPPMDGESTAQMDGLQPIIDYLMMSLSSGSETSRRWFEEISEYTHESLTSGDIGPALDPESEDSRMIAAVQTAMALGITAFYRTIQESLKIEDETELMIRVGKARLFLASPAILGADVRDHIARLLDDYQSTRDQKTTGKPPPDSASGND